MRGIRYLIDMAFAAGYGIALHGIANEAFYKGGYQEILSFQGEYIGLTMIVVSYVLMYMRRKKE